jgi:hypothetical protein
MAEITNPEAVRFCNERVRVAANKLNAAYKFAKEVQAEWFANDLATIIAYNNGDLVVDGSATDGRHPISGIDVNNLITRLSELTTDYDANSSAKLNTILAVATNNDVR